MCRCLLSFFAALLLLLNLSLPSVAGQSQIIFTVGVAGYEENGVAKTMDAVTFIENDRIYVPVRYLALALGVPEDKIEWNGPTQTVTLAKGDKELSLIIGRKLIAVNGKSKNLDVSPVLRADRTYLPARYVAEELGYEVNWDGRAGTVKITPPLIIEAPQNLFIATQKGKAGYINEKGRMVISPQFVSANNFSEGLAVVNNDPDHNCVINQSGEVVINPRGYFISGNFHDGRALVMMGETGKQAFIDKSGEVVIKPGFYQVKEFSHGLAAVQPEQGGKWGYIDTSGEMVISPQFTEAQSFSDELSRVSYGHENGGRGWFGFIDRAGEFVISPRYDSAEDFSAGYSCVFDGNRDRYYIIDKRGNTVIDSVPVNTKFSEGLAVIWGENNLCGYIDPGGKTVVEPQFMRADGFSEGLAGVRINGKHGFIDKTGQIVIEPQFISASQFSNGLAAVADQTGTGYIDKSGKIIFWDMIYPLIIN